MGDGATGFEAERLLQHAAWVRRVAAHLVVDAARADDVAQQTLLAALTQPPKRTDAPRAWLASVARSLARREARAEERRERHESVAPPSRPSPSAHDVVARAETQRALVDAVLALDEPYRTALLLRFFESRSPRAIAKETKAPVETVRTRLKRGLELLRERYVERRAQDWAVALVSLIEPRHWRGLRRLVAAKSSAAAVSVASGVGGTAVLGVVAMSTSLKVAAATAIVGLGVIAAIEFRGPSAPDAALATASKNRARSVAPESASPPSAAADAARTPEVPPSEPPSEKAIPAPRTATLEGVVVDASGEPVDDAIVLAERVQRGRASFATISDLAQNFDELELRSGVDADHGDLRRTTTDADGVFHFDELPPASSWNVAVVERTRGVALSIGLAIEDAGSTRNVEIALLEGVVLHGTVRDSAGNGLPGAMVFLTPFAKKNADAAATRRFGGGGSIISATCGPDGTYRTLALPFREFQFEFSARGYVIKWTRVPGDGGRLVVPENVHDHQEDCTLELAPRMRGAIVNLDGSPAHLAATDRTFDLVESLHQPDSGLNLSTGARGTIELATDRYEFVCEAGRPTYLSIWCNDRLLGWTLVPSEGDGPEIRIDLARLAPERAAALALEVVDGATGRPIPEFTVTTAVDALLSGARPVPEPESRVVHDVSGQARIEPVNPGSYVLTVRAPEFASHCRFVTLPTEPGAPALRIEMRRANASIRGKVVDRGGAPLAGAELCLRAPNGELALAPPDCVTKSNENGAFRFDGIAEGEWFVVADLEDFAPVAVHARDGDADVDVTLEPGVLVGFTFTSSDDGRTRSRNWCRILDEHGIPLVEDHRPVRSLLRLGPIRSQRLVEGLYTVEVASTGWHSEPVRFRAIADATVDIPLPAPTTSPQGK